jgi:hypothetical protein
VQSSLRGSPVGVTGAGAPGLLPGRKAHIFKSDFFKLFFKLFFFNFLYPLPLLYTTFFWPIFDLFYIL